MLSRRIVAAAPRLVKRNFGVAAPVLQKASDPIQQLFLDKINEYKQKSSSGKLDIPADLQKELKADLDKIAKAYGGGEGVDLTAFPKFNFQDPKIEVTSFKAGEA